MKRHLEKQAARLASLVDIGMLATPASTSSLGATSIAIPSGNRQRNRINEMRKVENDNREAGVVRFGRRVDGGPGRDEKTHNGKK